MAKHIIIQLLQTKVKGKKSGKQPEKNKQGIIYRGTSI